MYFNLPTILYNSTVRFILNFKQKTALNSEQFSKEMGGVTFLQLESIQPYFLCRKCNLLIVNSKRYVEHVIFMYTYIPLLEYPQ